MSRGTCTILPRRAAEFRQLARGIWQIFQRKTVGPTYMIHNKLLALTKATILHHICLHQIALYNIPIYM